MFIKWIWLTICLILTCLCTYSQGINSGSIWDNIQLALHNKKNLVQTRARLLSIKNQAERTKDPFDQARAFYYLMLIDDQRSEDSLYFKNSAFIDSILFDPSTTPSLKMLMHYLQGQRLWKFALKYKKFNRVRYERKDISINYAAFSDNELENMAQNHLEESRKQAIVMQNGSLLKMFSLDKIIWLSSSPLTFLYKPTLQDIILLEQVYFLLNDLYVPEIHYSQLKAFILLKPDDLEDAIEKVSFQNKRVEKLFRVFNDWLRIRQNDKEVYSFIEMLLKEYIYRLSENDKLVSKVYEAYLMTIIHSSFPSVRVSGIYQLCFLWHSWSMKYSTALNYYSSNEFKYDSVFQYYAAKSLELYRVNRNLFSRYNFMGKQLDDLEYRIVRPQLRLAMDVQNQRGKDILLRIEYKNISKLNYKIVRLNWDGKYVNDSSTKLKLLAREKVKSGNISLPLPLDYNLHRSFFKIDSLEPGRYAIVFSDRDLIPENQISVQVFCVTDIALLNTDNRVYVVSRENGMPLKGSQIIAYYTNTKFQDRKWVTDTVRTKVRESKTGMFEFDRNEEFNLQVIHHKDTLEEKIGVYSEESDDVYNDEDYDNLEEYLLENMNIHVFSDRAIYRPGQKVYYKGIILARDPKTGERLVLNKKNLRKSFGNHLKKWMKETDSWLYFKDPFGRRVDSVKINPDEYGSVAGFFQLPKKCATGDWEIESDEIETNYQNRGDIEVEEYKRPTFELKVDKPLKTYLLGDTLSFRIETRSYAGASLNGVEIQYSIVRKTLERSTLAESKTTELNLIDSVRYTNEEGVLVIQFVDTLLEGVDRSKNYLFTYQLDATATDETGETHDLSASLRTSTRPVTIGIPLPEISDISKLRSVLLSAKDPNGLDIDRKLTVELYKVIRPEMFYDRDFSKFADQWIHEKEQLSEWFTGYRFSGNRTGDKEELVIRSTIESGKYEKFRWPIDRLSPGIYKIVVSSMDGGYITGEQTSEIELFSISQQGLPPGKANIFHIPDTYLAASDTLRIISGSRFKKTYTITQLKFYSRQRGREVIRNFYNTTINEKGVSEWKWKIPKDAVGKLLVSQVFVQNNKVYHHEQVVKITEDNESPQIVIEQFRNYSYPGATASYTVSIKSRSKEFPAQLMTTIYDATLDKLSAHKWNIPTVKVWQHLKSDWNETTTGEEGQELAFLNKTIQRIENKTPIWWMEDIGIFIDGKQGINSSVIESLDGSVSGVLFSRRAGMGVIEVHSGYSVIRKERFVGSFTQLDSSSFLIRGINSIDKNSHPLIIIDNVPYTGDLSKINISDITDAVVLKDDAAASIWGARAAQGVLVISTKGKIELPKISEQPILKFRSNFNETAFFSPAIYADKKGFFRFQVTMPESVTEWNWKLFAHTMNMEYAYEERKLVTKLPLMVQSNLPSLLYQGDEIIIKNRITNLDTLMHKGKAVCKIEDAVTGENITNQILKISEVDFSIEGKTNTIVKYELIIPDQQLHPLKVQISARTEAFADGEEHFIPILSRNILVKHNQNILLTGKDSVVLRPALLENKKLYGIELSVEPKPQAALLNSLPYLANYSYDCAEQIFNKLNAHVIAMQILRKDSVLQTWKHNDPNLEKRSGNDVRPQGMAEELMPWLSLNHKTEKQQSALAELMDSVITKQKLNSLLKRLSNYQNSDGGMAWFNGGRSNTYISLYLLKGFGKLSRDYNLPALLNNSEKDQFEKIINGLVNYADSEYIRNIHLGSEHELNYAYSRSLWTGKFPMSDLLKGRISALLTRIWNTDGSSLHTKALLVIASLRYNSVEEKNYHKALEELKSIFELSITDDENGMRWKEIADSDEMNETAEETMAIIVEAFAEAGLEKEVLKWVQKWLLKNKNEQHWNTTVGTAAAIDVLMKDNETLLNKAISIEGTVNNKNVSVSDDLLKGKMMEFIKEEAIDLIHLKNESRVFAKANIGWYYFTPITDAKGNSQHVVINKRLEHLNEKTGVWELVNNEVLLKPGGKVKVVLSVETPKALKYVFIDDKKAASFQHLEFKSGYEIKNSISYYKSVRDEGVQFFAEFIPSGRTELSYEMKVTHEGKFLNGVAMLQCMYKPHITSYSRSQQINTEINFEKK